MLGHQDGRDIVIGNALFFQIEDHRKGKTEDAVDIALGEHRLTHRKADRFDLDFAVVQPRNLLEGWPLRKSAIRRRRAELLAFQRLRVASDTKRLAAHDGKCRAFIDHVNGLDLLARILIEELDHRIDVAETHLVSAGCHARNGLHRAVTAVDRHVEAFGLEVSLVQRQQETCCRSLEFPVEREFHRRFGMGARYRQRQPGSGTDCSNGQSSRQQPTR
ncbi:hypothetical protein D3C87_1582730 [compost metagenome]